MLLERRVLVLGHHQLLGSYLIDHSLQQSMLYLLHTHLNHLSPLNL